MGHNKLIVGAVVVILLALWWHGNKAKSRYPYPSQGADYCSCPAQSVCNPCAPAQPVQYWQPPHQRPDYQPPYYQPIQQPCATPRGCHQ